MKITLFCVGKTDDKHVLDGIEVYKKRLKHYINFEIVIIPDIRNSKNLTQQQQKAKEAELLLKNISNLDFVILLDERGKEFSSIEFSNFIEKQMISSVSQLVFLVGGPYGFDDSVYQRANFKISLSRMTFSHQMIRMFFVEQLYRAFTILRNEPYHHE